MWSGYRIILCARAQNHLILLWSDYHLTHIYIRYLVSSHNLTHLYILCHMKWYYLYVTHRFVYKCTHKAHVGHHVSFLPIFQVILQLGPYLPGHIHAHVQILCTQKCTIYTSSSTFHCHTWHHAYKGFGRTRIQYQSIKKPFIARFCSCLWNRTYIRCAHKKGQKNNKFPHKFAGPCGIVHAKVMHA